LAFPEHVTGGGDLGWLLDSLILYGNNNGLDNTTIITFLLLFLSHAFMLREKKPQIKMKERDIGNSGQLANIHLHFSGIFS
jgi:hypothetical protein